MTLWGTPPALLQLQPAKAAVNGGEANRALG